MQLEGCLLTSLSLTVCSLAAATPVASSIVALSIVASLRWELVQLLALIVAHLATLTSIHVHVRCGTSHL